ncbi:MAG: class I SAM-dependent DNA methyltransferase [Cyanobacteriota bacterium]|jgi:type I restriction enzyme M protein
MAKSQTQSLPSSILERLKNTPEQEKVVGPLVQVLLDKGWLLEQIIFGKKEWYVPKSPSEQTKREKGLAYSGFPVDIAVFDSISNVGDPRHVLFIIECKQPSETAGVSQLEAYFVGEPYARLGIWANNSTPSAQGVFIYRKTDGRILIKRRYIDDLPIPGEVIDPEAQRISLCDLITPTEQILCQVIQDILDKVVIADNYVTRREEQLDQLCNLLLLKLESDKQGKADPTKPVFFRSMESIERTAEAIKERYSMFVELYPETFTTDEDKKIKFGNETIALCVDILSDLRLIDLGVATVSVAFQILRSEALKQGEGQYFTPNQVIQAGIRLMQIKFEDIVIDPACGTGGFLVEAILDMKRQNPNMPESELSRWAQTHIYGIEKDAIGLKLAKAIMQIAGDGSAHCMRGDSVRVHNWMRDFPHLNDGTMRNGRFSVVVTNPPFGQNLKISANDSRLSQLDIARCTNDNYGDLEIGLIFLQRCHQLLRVGGRIGIVLPETYFFSSNYAFLLDWIKPRLRPLIVANIPMDAFQGFCRAKTNFYVFEKIA